MIIERELLCSYALFYDHITSYWLMLAFLWGFIYFLFILFFGGFFVQLEAEVAHLKDALNRETDRANEAQIDLSSERTKAERVDRELHKER